MEQHPVKSCQPGDGPRLRRTSVGRRTAFTLIELLVVLAIVVVVMTLTLPSLRSLSESSEIGQGGQIVVDQLTEARQSAATFNVKIEVRLLQVPTPTNQGYGAIQIWGTGLATGTSRPLTRVVTLPNSVAISSSPTLSGLLALLPAAQTMTVNGISTPVPYVSFYVRPSGIVEPVPATDKRSNLFLTVTPARFAGSGNTTAPANYFTVQLNPDTAAPLSYRP